MLESEYQAKLIKRLRKMFFGCIILKNDSAYQQGIPDLLIVWGRHWAFLEVKASAAAPEQPNQRVFVEYLNQMSFAAFIYPENEEEVLNVLQQSFTSRRAARVPQRLQG